jgi:hypothetical protein
MDKRSDVGGRRLIVWKKVYRGKQIWDMLKDPCFWRCCVEIVVHIRLMNIEMIDELEALQL